MLLRTMVTGKDNQSLDAHRVLLFFFAVALVAQQVYALVSGHQFDQIAAASAYAGLLAGSGAGLWMKRSTEPGEH